MEPSAVADGRGSPMALPWELNTYNMNENNMKMITFAEYVAMREGLWLNDKNAVVGLSKMAPPKPPKKIKRPHVPKVEGSLDQLHRSVDDLSRMGIGLLPPKRDDLKRLIDKQKNQVTVPISQEPTPGTAPAAGPGPAVAPTARREPVTPDHASPHRRRVRCCGPSNAPSPYRSAR